MIGELWNAFIERVSRDWHQITASAAIHGVLVLLLLLFVVDTGVKPRRLLQTLEEQEEKQDEFLEELKDDTVVLDKPLSIMNEMPGTLSESTELIKGDPSPTNEAAMAREINNKSRNRPLTSSLGKLSIGSTINGMKGTADNAAGGMGRGLLDVITREILRNLRKGPVLVAWIMDASGSMEGTRNLIADRFDSIYKELGSVGAARGDSLLTAIASCGHDTLFLTDKPTTDVPTIAKAIRSVKDDGTGEENFFDGIMKTATKYRRFQAGGKRIFMIIVVTDEIGDDSQNIDEATKMAQRNKTLVYVLGPGSSFGYPDILVSATNDQGDTFQVPVRRGPATRASEVLSVPFNTTPYKHAFGPFGLSYISRESGAIYWVFDDGRLSGPEYDPATLAPYKPFYGTMPEYLKEAGKNELRRTLLEVVERGDKTPMPGAVSTEVILAQEAAKKVGELEKQIMPWLNFARQALPRMEAADAKRKEEASPAWLANFDLSMGRLLLAKVTCEEYVDALQKAKAPIPGGQGNAWQITQTTELDARGGGVAPAVGPDGTPIAAPVSGLATAPPDVLVEKAREYLQRVINEHPNTPWAAAAQAEMNSVMGFDAVPTSVQVQQGGGGGVGGNRGGAGEGGNAGTAPPRKPGPPPKL